MKNKTKYLSKNILLFTLNSFVPKAIAFFLIPLYTTYLSVNEYGIADLITTTATLLIPILTLDVQDAVLRFSMDKSNSPKDVFSNALKINFIGLFISIICVLILNYYQVFHVPSYFYLFLIINYFSNALLNSLNHFCKGIDKIKHTVIGSIINSVLTLSFSVILIVVFKLGIIGYLIANNIGIIISLIYLIYVAKLHQYITLKYNKKLMKEMLMYSFPLVFSVIAWWINSASDRYIITFICGVSASGLYAVANKIPSLLTIFQNILTQAWSISAIKDFDKNDSDGFIGKMYTIINLFMCLLCSLIMLLNVFISKILFANEFAQAWQYVPPLLLSVVFNAMALFIGGILTAVKDTKSLSFSTITGALINTILNFVLISYFKAYGAAIATLIGYFIVLVLRNIKVKKHIKIKTNIFKNYLSYILLLIQMFLAYFGNKYIIIQVIIPIIIILIYRNHISEIFKEVKKLTVKLIKN